MTKAQLPDAGNPLFTIAAAARHCGVDRRTLQRAIRAGRLALTVDHRVTSAALTAAGYAPAAPLRHAALPVDAAAAPQGLDVLVHRLAALEAAVTALAARLEAQNAAAAPQGHSPPPSRHARRAAILAALADAPDGLTAQRLRTITHAARPLGDTLKGMVRDGVIVRVGYGRYRLA